MTAVKTARSRQDACTRKARQHAELAAMAYEFEAAALRRLREHESAGLSPAALADDALAVQCWRQLGDGALNLSTRATEQARVHAAEAAR